jgi:hypothetical protein
MKLILVVPLVVGLVLAPAAVAKGPHAVLTSGPEPIEAGAPWESTIELNEFADTPRPSLIAISAQGHVDADVRPVPASMADALGFKMTMVFPAEGRWRLMLIAGSHRFKFPSIDVGGAAAPQDYVSFPVGSEAARQGGGGVYMEPEPVDEDRNGVRPPEVFNIAGDAESGDDGDGGTLATWWLLPLGGVVLAGAGIATLRARR